MSKFITGTSETRLPLAKALYSSHIPSLKTLIGCGWTGYQSRF